MKKQWLTAGIIATTVVAAVVVAIVMSPKSDLEQASAAARRGDKHLLIYFNGSDWCGWCKRLDAEVFNKAEFAAYAGENLVCYQANFPKRDLQPEEKKRSNQELALKYAVQAVPTVVLLNPSGEWIGSTGYRPGGSEKYVEHLKAIINAYAETGIRYTAGTNAAKYKETRE